MHRTLAALVSVICVMAMAWTATAADPDWPQWRGINRDGKSAETGLLASWPEGGPPLAWKATGIGKGYSGVSIAGGKIFTMGDREGSEFLICLDLGGDHKELWATKVGAPYGDGGPRCTPTTDGDLVFALSPHGDFVCCQMADGKEVWRKKFDKDFGGKMMSGWSYSESPLVDGDNVICTPGGKEALVVALNKKTGETVWKSTGQDMGGAGYASIVISQGGGVKQYVTIMGRGAIGVAAKDGKILWTYGKIANGTANIPTPIVTGDFVFVSTAYKTGAALLKLSAADGGVKAEEVYFLAPDVFQNHHGGMVLVGDYLYAGHGHNAGQPVCIELKTGKIVWRGEKGPGDGSAAVCFADGNVYFRFQNGQMMLVGANPEKFENKGVFRLASVTGNSWPHPVIQGGKLFIRDNDTLLAYDIKKK